MTPEPLSRQSWRATVYVCSECGELVEREIHGDCRWACPTHGNQITIESLEVVPYADLFEARRFIGLYAAYAPAETHEKVREVWNEHEAERMAEAARNG